MTAPLMSTPRGSARSLFGPRPLAIRAVSNRKAGCLGASRRDLLVSTTLLGAAASVPGASEASEDPTSTAAPSIPRTDLAPGLNISRCIKGTWQLSGGHRGEKESDRTVGSAAVADFQPFVDAGITTFDTADHYGPAEELIGKFLETHWKEENKVQVLTKFCAFGGMMRQSAEFRYVEQMVDRSRLRLGVPSLDLLQFYWADYGDSTYVKAAQHLAELQARGAIKHIGITNFDVPRIEAMLNAGVPIVSNQVQYSLLDRRPELFMAPFCAQRGIQLLCYGTVAGGFLSEKYLGTSPRDVKLDTYSKSKYARVIGEAGGWGWFQELLRTLSTVAAKHSVTIADVASKWVLDKPTVAAVIVGARNASHIADHQRMCVLELDGEDTAAIQAVLDKGNLPTSDCYTWERGGQW